MLCLCGHVSDLYCSLYPHLKEASPLKPSDASPHLSVSLLLPSPLLFSTPTSLPILIGMDCGKKTNSLPQNCSTSPSWMKWIFWTLEVSYISNQRYTHTRRNYRRSKAAVSIFCSWKPSRGRRQEGTQVQSPNAIFTLLKCHTQELVHKPDTTVHVLKSPLKAPGALFDIKSSVSF